MKNCLICLSLVILLIVSDPLLARGGRGGGGGGRGGGGRTPSMSRSVSRPASSSAPRAQTRSQSRPQARPQAKSQANRRVMTQNQRPSKPVQAERPRGNSGNLARTPSMSNPQQRQGAPRIQNQANIRDTAKQYRDKRPFRGDISKVPQARQNNVRAALPQKFQGQRLTSNRVGDYVRRSNPDYRDWFTPGFNARHDFHSRYELGDNLWRRAGWNDLNSWLGYGWSDPYYYDYGYPVELTAGTYEIYSTPAADQAAPPSQSENWISLGVFAAGKNESQAAYSNMFVQMALDKQGNLAGTYYNAATDKTYALDGYVDQQTQEAFWRLSDKPDSPLMSTGIFNLTQDVVPVTVVFSSTNEQNWVLVRVNE